MDKVLVTGVTGFIGLHCVQQLLNKGFKVNGTLRSFDRKDEVINALSSHKTSTEHLTLFETDLMDDKGWDQAIEGCDYVLHVASPFVLSNESLDFFVKPAVEGATRALKFAQKNNVKKVVLTSSIVAMIGSMKNGTFGPENWTDISAKNINTYARSKTLAEKAAWDFAKSNNIELVVNAPSSSCRTIAFKRYW